METAERSEWLRVREAAEELKIPRTKCYELIQEGKLPAVRVAERTIRINRRELETFLLEQRRTGPQASHTSGEAAM